MELFEMYAMHLHGEDPVAMGATETQQLLIKLMDAYPDIKELNRELKKLDTVRRRHLAGIEFCGGSPRSRIESSKIDVIIEAIEKGKSCKAAATEAGTSVIWALRQLHANGYYFDNDCKQWKKAIYQVTCTFEIPGHTKAKIQEHKPRKRDKQIEFEKIQKVIELIESGNSMRRAAFIADIDPSQASNGLHELGYICINRKWVKQSVTPTTDMPFVSA